MAEDFKFFVYLRGETQRDTNKTCVSLQLHHKVHDEVLQPRPSTTCTGNHFHVNERPSIAFSAYPIEAIYILRLLCPTIQTSGVGNATHVPVEKPSEVGSDQTKKTTTQSPSHVSVSGVIPHHSLDQCPRNPAATSLIMFE